MSSTKFLYAFPDSINYLEMKSSKQTQRNRLGSSFVMKRIKCQLVSFPGYSIHQTLLIRSSSSQITRHFLLLTATPHNGKKKISNFCGTPDGDRFEGRFRMEFIPLTFPISCVELSKKTWLNLMANRFS